MYSALRSSFFIIKTNKLACYLDFANICLLAFDYSWANYLGHIYQIYMKRVYFVFVQLLHSVLKETTILKEMVVLPCVIQYNMKIATCYVVHILCTVCVV